MPREVHCELGGLRSGQGAGEGQTGAPGGADVVEPVEERLGSLVGIRGEEAVSA